MNISEQEILREIASGNEKAFRQLFGRYWDNIYGIAFALTKSSGLAEEMVQDVFVKIWLKRMQLTTVICFEAYLYTIARNHIFNTLRKKVREVPFTEELIQYLSAHAHSPEQQLLLKESEMLISKAVAQLPPRQYLIYQLSRQQGLSQEEIARRLKISVNTVKSHMNKALHAIRSYLQQSSSGAAFFICMLLLPF